MPERVNPNTTSFTVGTVEQTIYVPLAVQEDTEVSFFNAGETLVRIRFGSETDYIPISSGTGITCNPHANAYATVDSGSSTIIVARGVKTFSSGVSSTGYSKAEAEVVSSARTQKQLLADMLLQLRITNEHLARVNDETVTERDLDRC